MQDAVDAETTPKEQLNVKMPENLSLTSSQEACPVSPLLSAISGETVTVSGPRVTDTDVEVVQPSGWHSLVSALSAPKLHDRVYVPE
jgi:hypothetical protein